MNYTKTNIMMNYPVSPVTTELFDQVYYLASNPPVCIEEAICRSAPKGPCKPKIQKEKEKEHNMGCELNNEQEAKRHLQNRLWDASYIKGGELREKYFMNGENLPKTKDELLAALKAGQIEFDAYSFDKSGNLREGYNVSRSFKLVDPKQDKAGFDAATKVMSKTRQDADDIIRVLTPADGLAALKAFETATF